ncbi:MAG: hypothetical protein AB1793_06790 [Candidatus Thermoplasmatota archaeon]
MAEKRVGLIPRVLQPGGSSAYSVLVTSERILLIPDKPPEPRPMEALRMMFSERGEAPALSPVDYRTDDLDEIAARDGSVAIPLIAVKRAMVENVLGTYMMTIEQAHEGGKSLSNIIVLAPPSELVKENKGAGLSARETKLRYARKCQELVRRVLTPTIISEGKWLD